MNAVTTFQQVTGKGLSLIAFSQPFAECATTCELTNFPTTPLDNVRSYGAVPILNWTSASSPSRLSKIRPSPCADVIDGTYDGYIRYFAAESEGMGPPLLPPLQLGDERVLVPLVGGGQRQQTGEFVAAWRHVHDIFTAEGGDQRDLGLVPERQLSTANWPSCRPLYPGDRYVDWTCLDGFNWGKRTGSPGWLSFNKIYHRTYREIVKKIAPGKPMMIGEIATSESRRLEGGLDRRHASQGQEQVPAGAGAGLVGRERSRHQLADRDVLAAGPKRVQKGDRQSGLPPQPLRGNSAIPDRPAASRLSGWRSARPPRRPSSEPAPPRLRGGPGHGRSCAAGGSPRGSCREPGSRRESC